MEDKCNFRIGLCSSGAFCFVREAGGATESVKAYLRKDKTLANYYDGNFFPSLVEAAKFLEDYLATRTTEVTRAQVAKALGVSKDFVLVD